MINVKHITVFFLCLLFADCETEHSEKKKEVVQQPVIINGTGVSTNGLQSAITCPKCNYSAIELLPTEICLLKYTCSNCNEILFPKEGDCCVFCTYGTVKCPSMQ